MKKIMKRLLTGVLTLATVFTALPVVTQVHAADSVYTTTDGKAGTIVKIDNGGSEVSSFEESIMNADGQIAYCIDINTNFQSGYKNRINATERMSDDQISDVALNLEYVKQYAEKHSLSSKQVYLFLETFFKLYPTATKKELAYYVSGNVLEPVNCDYMFSELVNPIFIKSGEQVKVSVSVKYLDQRTKAIQISQFDLTLEKDSNWKIVK